MTRKLQPNEIAPKPIKDQHPATGTLNAIEDPKLVLKMKKKRHLSGLMCPPMGGFVISQEVAGK